MATATFAYSGSSPASVGDSDAARVVWPLGLYNVGASRGGNVTVGDADGTLSRSRSRAELPVELRWRVQGDEDLDGNAAADVYRQLRHNIRDLHVWFDSAPGREVTVTLSDGTSWSADANHEEFDDPEWHGRFVFVRHLITVPDGILT